MSQLAIDCHGHGVFEASDSFSGAISGGRDIADLLIATAA